MKRTIMKIQWTTGRSSYHRALAVNCTVLQPYPTIPAQVMYLKPRCREDLQDVFDMDKTLNEQKQ